jgi:hypothetical protein
LTGFITTLVAWPVNRNSTTQLIKRKRRNYG